MDSLIGNLKTMINLDLQPIDLRIEKPYAHVVFTTQSLVIQESTDSNNPLPTLIFTNEWAETRIDLNRMKCEEVDGNHRYRMRNLQDNTLYWFHIVCAMGELQYSILKREVASRSFH
jgi:hypothetical protein